MYYYQYLHFTDGHIETEWLSHFSKSQGHDRYRTFLIPRSLLVTSGQYGLLIPPV